ncbi:amidase [Streptomyces albus]|nr:amidase [Streptomyces albus]
MEYAEYRAHDAVGLAALVAGGEVSAAELLEVAVARAEAVDGKLNAIVRPMYDLARDRTRTPLTGPFAGVPFLIKDLSQDYAGLPTGSGSRSLAHLSAERHSAVVERWLEAGLVIFGKTNTPEFGAKGITEPEVNGPTRNPWDLSRTPGGSSGGSAAAVAAGVVPMAGANDGGGSIRIPAACCGLFGLKPGRGLVPAGPATAEDLHGAATNGAVSRTVRDSAALLDVLTARPDPGGPYLAARPELPYAELARRPRPLRIGFTTRSPIGTEVDPHAVAAVDETVGLLARLGHQVELPNRTSTTGSSPSTSSPCGPLNSPRPSTRYAAPPAPDRATSNSTPTCWPPPTAPSPRPDTSPPTSAGTPTAGSSPPSTTATTCCSPPPWPARRCASASWTPRAPVRTLARGLMKAGLLGTLAGTKAWERAVIANLAATPYTQLANITGRPATSVPTYRTPEGLPLGTQFVGPLGGEGMLLALAAQIEAEQPWAHREPAL